LAVQSKHKNKDKKGILCEIDKKGEENYSKNKNDMSHGTIDTYDDNQT
jgi:hypothetical protein